MVLGGISEPGYRCFVVGIGGPFVSLGSPVQGPPARYVGATRGILGVLCLGSRAGRATPVPVSGARLGERVKTFADGVEPIADFLLPGVPVGPSSHVFSMDPRTDLVAGTLVTRLTDTGNARDCAVLYPLGVYGPLGNRRSKT